MKHNQTPYFKIKRPCGMENKSAFFEIFLSNHSTLKISVHTNDFDFAATLPELDFRPSSKTTSLCKNLQKPFLHYFFF